MKKYLDTVDYEFRASNISHEYLKLFTEFHYDSEDDLILSRQYIKLLCKPENEDSLYCKVEFGVTLLTPTKLRELADFLEASENRFESQYLKGD